MLQRLLAWKDGDLLYLKRTRKLGFKGLLCDVEGVMRTGK